MSKGYFATVCSVHNKEFCNTCPSLKVMKVKNQYGEDLEFDDIEFIDLKTKRKDIPMTKQDCQCRCHNGGLLSESWQCQHCKQGDSWEELESFYRRMKKADEAGWPEIRIGIQQEQDEYVKGLLAQAQSELLERVEEAFKESAVNVARNHGETFYSKVDEEAYAKGAWVGFKGFYLNEKLSQLQKEVKGK